MQIGRRTYEQVLSESVLPTTMLKEKLKTRHIAVGCAFTIRKAKDLSQAEFAKLIGVPTGTYQGWEQGRRKPTGAALSLLRIIARKPDTVEMLKELLKNRS
jgi:DNA-binding transcriptional regulator YiaG